MEALDFYVASGEVLELLEFASARLFNSHTKLTSGNAKILQRERTKPRREACRRA
jgi:hypothetical protein